MQDWNFSHEAAKAGLAATASLLTVLLGWFVGQRLSFAWNVRQKRRELQLAASQQFYAAYGEFFVVWKLWNRLDRSNPAFEERRWELHKRSAAAEAIVEGILVKLSSELCLSEDQICNLGRFRQAFQLLREVIREGRILPWTSSEQAEYKCFKDLAVKMAVLLASDWPKEPPTHERASGQLLSITSNRWEGEWQAQVAAAQQQAQCAGK